MDYQKTLQIAKDANKHARSIIIKGSSWTQNNDLDTEYFKHLLRGVEGTYYTKSEEIGMRDIIYDEINRRMKSGESEVLATFHSVVAVSTKYSLGNCYELSFLALDYILNHFPEMRAELYKIEYGDHAFLVLNRDPDSFMDKPHTWGENAIVCDPLANEVYPAKECFDRLRSSFNNENENRTIPFDPEEHVLMLVEGYNTSTLREEIRNAKTKHAGDVKFPKKYT